MATTTVTAEPAAMGPYRLVELIGRGGMGEVYRAYDTRRGRQVALKILPPELGRDEGFRARFRRESDNAARLQDPHVIPIHDFGEIDGRMYIDMRLVDGVGLDRLVAAGPMDPRRAVGLIGQAADALHDAHANGVVHRDVKPSNMLVSRTDFVHLIDFGIARMLDDDLTALTHSGATVGTLAYMAPERFEGGAFDARSDIYSLACMLAELLTGHRPFDATSLPSLMKAHLMADPPRPSREHTSIPPALDEVIARGMAKDPAARYASARELAAAALLALQDGAPVPTSTVVLPRRRRLAGLAVGAILLTVFSGVTGFALGRAGSSSGTASPAAALQAAASTSPAAAPQTPASTSLPAAPPRTNLTRGTGGRPPTYHYTVESNYPLYLAYIGSSGDLMTATSVPAPFRLTVDTATWGADARPQLSAGSSSTKGDTTVTCTITDDRGSVLANQTKSAAFAAVACIVF